MKVAILTQPLGHNYGGLIQAYALQKYLIELGCEVETLDRRRPRSIYLLTKTYFLNFIRLALGRIVSIPTPRKQALVLRQLVEFRDRRIIMSRRITGERDLRSYCRANKFEAYIVGSDQVWRPRYSPSLLNFYLDFVEDLKSPATRLAYAASFGVDSWEYSDGLTDRCKLLVEHFSAVSVRENSAIRLCKNKFGITAKCVVDPTLLLEPEEYDLLINEGNENKEGCALSYLLDSDQEKRFIAEMVGKTLAVEVFSFMPKYSVEQVHSRDINKCSLPSVETWLQAFRDASFVVTDSFHGTVLAILFNKPFIAIGNSARGMARFESLLFQFKLLDRLVKRAGEVNAKLIQSQIDWDTVNCLRRCLKNEGREFINKNLFGES